MSFELNHKDTFAENVSRIARERLDAALAVLPDGGDDTIHAARKDLKKLRALLRLARTGLGEETFQRENTDLRDAGRALSAMRDAQVLVQAFDGLRGEAFGRIAPETAETIRRQLADDVRATGETLAAQGQLPAAAETLRRVRERVDDWPLSAQDKGWRVPGRGLTAVYRKGRRAMRRAAAASAEGDFHEWRKQVKYFAAQVRLLGPLRPKRLEKLRCALDRIADLLGDEHDLSVLRDHLTARPDTWMSPHDLEVIGEVIETHRQALRAGALEIGRVVYAKKSARIRRRFKRDWQAWRAGK